MAEENTPTTTQYKQVTVDIPEDRLAEFHRFVGRFLAGPSARGRGRHARHHTGPGGRRCGPGRVDAPEQGQSAQQPAATTEL